MSRLEKVRAFIEFLPVTKGVLCGERMRLLPFQVAFLKMVYGADPQPKLAIQSLPRGNGKTGLVSALVLCHLLGPEAEARGEVYSVAVTQNQAGIVHAEAVAIIRAVPAFSARVAITEQRKRIEVLEGDGVGSTYASLAADHGPALGLAPSLWVYDEMGATKDRRLFDALLTASGKRTNTLGVVISTQAEVDDHHLSVLIDEARAGRARNVACQIMVAPLDADPFDIETLRTCNPAAGIYLNESDLVAKAEMAANTLAFEPAFRRFHLNQRVRTDEDARIVDAATWNRGAVPVDEAALVGKPCIGGYDSAVKHDLVAFLATFTDKDGVVDILARFWTPLGRMQGRRPSERELFEQWLRAGWLIGVPGDIIDPAWVLRELSLFNARFPIQEIRYDKSYMDGIKLEMTKAGIVLPFVEFRQGFISMGPALQHLADKLRAGQVRHGGNPILTHCIGNAVVVADAADNMKFHKGRSHSTSKLRIDGAVALAMAMAPGPSPPPPREFTMMFI